MFACWGHVGGKWIGSSVAHQAEGLLEGAICDWRCHTCYMLWHWALLAPAPNLQSPATLCLTLCNTLIG